MTKTSQKVLLLGVDAMDPSISKKYLEEGVMPNLKKLIERGATNTDLEMIGGEPTVTPPMWTTLATGAPPRVHGITAYFRTGKDKVSTEYNFDSRKCAAEQLWNVTAEAGLKTLVWHWPGSSWPPSSESKNLFVVDGTQPGGPNCGVAQVDAEKFIIASEQTKVVTYKEKAATDSHIPCLIDDMEIEENQKDVHATSMASEIRSVNTWKNLSNQMSMMAAPPEDVVFSSIHPASGWTAAPTDAKEFTILHSKGLVRRPCLLIKTQDVYDTVQIFKNKKETTPIATLKVNEFVANIVDEVIYKEKPVMCNRNMCVLEIAEDGSNLRIWCSAAMDFHNNAMWSPTSLLSEIVENVGYPQPVATVGGEERLLRNCTLKNWDVAKDWNADCIHYLIDKYDFDVVFSHFHSIDLIGHMIVKYLKDGSERLPAKVYQDLMRDTYIQADEYIGRFLHFLDEGWTILLISDHGQACPEHEAYPSMLMDGAVTATHMVSWGYTVLKKDENGNDLPEVDMSKSRAVMDNTCMLYINLKGRDPEGIVDPANQFELEEQIISDLYSLRDPVTNHRVISLALRNKDARIFGEGGPEAGDIIYKLAEGYNQDHGDSLSTTKGYFDTSVASIFVAAGQGIKKGIKTPRQISHVDVAPTVASLLQIRMPAQCEGSPLYQIMDKDIF